MKDEALRLALEALEYMDVTAERYVDKQIPEKAITAIKEALAQPEPNYKKALEVWLDKTEWVQETVKPHELGMHRADVLKQRIQEALAQPKQDGKCKHCTDGCPACDARKLPEQKPYAFEASMYSNDRMKVDPVTGNVSIGTPQRTWVGLTDEEINLIYAEPQTHIGQYARAIEAKLRSKNDRND
jgi:hypothetical protein